MHRIFIIFLLVVVAEASGSEISEKVKTGTYRPFFSYLNVHASDIAWLKAGGKKYIHVKGYKPNFLEIENLNAIFFITDTGTSSSEKIAHFVEVDGKMEWKIKFNDYISIGSSGTSVSIVSFKWPIVVVKSVWPEFVDIFEFNLSTRSYILKRSSERSKATESQKAPNQALQTMTMTVPVAAEPLCGPAIVMSDLKRWAKKI